MTDEQPPHPFGSDEWLSQAVTAIVAKQCPECDTRGELKIAREFVPSERFSLAGAQAKLSGRFEIVMRCGACGLAGRLHE